jgi:hypothetical protein
MPPHKTKQGQIHRVALSAPAIELLRSMERQRRDHRVFPTAGKRGPSGDKLLRAWRKAAGDEAVSLHASSRAGFDDFVSEYTKFPAKVIDRACRWPRRLRWRCCLPAVPAFPTTAAIRTTMAVGAKRAPKYRTCRSYVPHNRPEIRLAPDVLATNGAPAKRRARKRSSCRSMGPRLWHLEQ